VTRLAYTPKASAFFQMLATPVSISRPKKIFSVDDGDYSHFTQTRWNYSDATVMGVTFNRTRTYGSNGSPKDSDND